MLKLENLINEYFVNVTGSKKEAKVFDGLKPSESKARLRIMAEKMDTNKDGKISSEELKQWIGSSMKKLDAEEAVERYQVVKVYLIIE